MKVVQKTSLICLCAIILFSSVTNSQTILEAIEGGCLPTGIFCKSSTSFTFCTRIGSDSLLIVNEFFCPEGYFCNDLTNYPCVLPEEITVFPTTEELTTSFTVSPTTKKPVQPPICIGKGVYEGPTCSQYYECVSASWISYKAVLRTCTAGLYFSKASKSCVKPENSGCID